LGNTARFRIKYCLDKSFKLGELTMNSDSFFRHGSNLVRLGSTNASLR